MYCLDNDDSVKKCLYNLKQKSGMQAGQSLPVTLHGQLAGGRYAKAILTCMAISVADTHHPLKLLPAQDSSSRPTCLLSQLHGRGGWAPSTFLCNSNCWAFILGLHFYFFLRRRNAKTHLMACILPCFLLSLDYCLSILTFFLCIASFHFSNKHASVSLIIEI